MTSKVISQSPLAGDRIGANDAIRLSVRALGPFALRAFYADGTSEPVWNEGNFSRAFYGSSFVDNGPQGLELLVTRRGGWPFTSAAAVTDIGIMSLMPGKSSTLADLRSNGDPDAGIYLVGSANGEGGVYAWRQDDPTPEDGATIVASTLPGAPLGRWRRLYSGPKSTMWFGTVGDGIADDTAAIQSALNSKGDVYLPPGTYKCTSPLELGTHTRFFGEGESSVISAQHNGNAIERVNPLSGSYGDYSYVELMTIQGPNADHGQSGVYDQDGSFFGVRRCTIAGFSYGVRLNQSEDAFVRDCHIDSVIGCVWLQDAGFVNAIFITGNHFGSGICGVIDEGGVTHVISQNDFEGKQRVGYYRWAHGHAYSVGDKVYGGPYGLFFTCTTGGISGGAEPAWPTSGTIGDGGVTWTTGDPTTPATKFLGSCAIYVAGAHECVIEDNYFEENVPAIIFGVSNFAGVLDSAALVSIGASFSIHVRTNSIVAFNGILDYGGFPFFNSAGPQVLTTHGNEFNTSFTPIIGMGGMGSVSCIGDAWQTFPNLTDSAPVGKFFQVSASGLGQVGIGAAPGPRAALDVGGTVAYRTAMLPIANMDPVPNVGIVVSTAVVELSGITGNFTIAGIAGGVDGQTLEIISPASVQLTLAHQSTAETTPVNRIICPAGADRIIPAPGAGGATVVRLRYSGNVNRWYVT